MSLKSVAESLEVVVYNLERDPLAGHSREYDLWLSATHEEAAMALAELNRIISSPEI